MYKDEKGREYSILNAGGSQPYRASYRKDRFSKWRYLLSIPWQEDPDKALEALSDYAKKYRLQKVVAYVGR